MRDVVQALEAPVRTSGRSLELGLDDQPLPVKGDRERLAQVVWNLLDNAVKFTGAGGAIRVALERGPTGAVLRVSDNGVGMLPSLVARVFDLFVQGSVPLARAQGGLGVGLALVRSLVEQHGGTVAARSPGIRQGSEFTVTLPLFSAADAAGETETRRTAYGA